MRNFFILICLLLLSISAYADTPKATLGNFDFEDGLQGWTVGGTADSQWSHGVFSHYDNATPSIWIDSDAAGSGTSCVDVAISPVFDFSGMAEATVNMDYAYRRISADLNLIYRVDGGDWVDAYSFTANSMWDNVDISLPAGALVANVELGIFYDDNGSWDWYAAFDNVTISADAGAPAIVSFTGNTAPPDTEMNLSLTLEEDSAINIFTSTYNIGGGDVPLTWNPVITDETYSYTATLPAQPHGTMGTVSMYVEDDLGYSDTYVRDIVWGDFAAPVLTDISGNDGYVDYPLNISATFEDDNDIAFVNGYYDIGFGATSFSMSSAKANFLYTGEIPAQSSLISGVVWFEVEDINGNNGTTDQTPINWNLDTMPPSIVEVTGNTVEADMAMNISLTLEDETEINPQTVFATYHTEGGEAVTVQMLQPEAIQETYYLEIPAMPGGTEGTVVFKFADVNGNESTSMPYPIEWMGQSMVYTYDFEDGVQGWTVGGTPDEQWSWGTYSGLGNDTNLLWIDSDAAGSGTNVVDTAISPVLDFSGWGKAVLEMDYLYRDLGAASLFLLYRVDGGDWVEIHEFNTQLSFAPFDIELPSDVITSNVEIGVYYDDNNAWDWYAAFDNVTITLFEDYDAPQIVSIDGLTPGYMEDTQITIQVEDANEIASVTGTYGGTNNLNFASPESKMVYDFISDIIPDQGSGAVVPLEIVIEDINGNSDTFNYDIVWEDSPYVVATTPIYPTDGQTMVPDPVTLEWNIVDNADGYRLSVYYEDDGMVYVVNDMDLGDVTTYDLGTLEDLTEYYWTVTPYNGYGALASPPVWSFKAEYVATATYLNEGFESGDIPTGWTQEDGVTDFQDWIVATGGYSSNPAAAHSGSYNARLYFGSYTSQIKKLITPAMDLSGESSVLLNFWHAQMDWSGDQDVLRVYYKTSSAGAWNMLSEYTDATDWTERSIVLNDLSDDFYIAFEGATHYGYGVCIDDVLVKTPDVLGTVEGHVTKYGTTEPLENVMVQIEGYSELTDEFGYYSITVPAGHQNVTFTKDGFATYQEAGYPVIAEQTSTLDVAMQYSSIDYTASPSPFNVTVDAGGNYGDGYLSITNTGSSDLDYKVRITEPMPVERYLKDLKIVKKENKNISLGKDPNASSSKVEINNEVKNVLSRSLDPSFATGINLSEDAIISINTNDASVVSSDDFPFRNYAMDYDAESADYLYIYYGNNDSFYKVDANTYELLHNYGPLNYTGSITGLSCDKSTNIIYLSTSDAVNTYIYKIDMEPFGSTLVATFDGIMIDIAFDGHGNLYGHDLVNDVVSYLNMETGEQTQIVATGYDGNYAQGMSWDPVKNAIYLAHYDGTNGRLLEFDIYSGTIDYIGDLPGEVDGLCFPGRLSEWMSITENQVGTVPAGQTVTVPVYLDASGMRNITKEGLLVIDHNGLDEVETTENIPVQMTVSENTNPALCAENPMPESGTLYYDINNGTLSWTNPDVYLEGVKIKMWYDDGTDSNVYITSGGSLGEDIGVAESYTYPTPLEYNMPYYWQVIPYNNVGDATDCPVWSFKTDYDPSMTPITVVSPESHNFGEMGVDNISDPVMFTITNDALEGSGADLVISSIVLGDDTNFSIVDPFMGTYPTIAPQNSITFEVVFNPMSAGNFATNIQITDNVTENIHQIPLSGVGVEVPGETIEDAMEFTLNRGDSFSDNGNTSLYFNDYTLPQNYDNRDVVYRVNITEDMWVTASLEGSNYDTKIAIYNSAEMPSYDNALYYNDDFGNDSDNSKKVSKVKNASDSIYGWSKLDKVHLESGEYWLVIDGWGNSSGNYMLDIQTSPLFELPAYLSLNEDELTTFDFSSYIDAPEGYELVVMNSDGLDVIIDGYSVDMVNAVEHEYGMHTLEFMLTNNPESKGSIYQSVEVEVMPINDPPILNVTDEISVNEDGTMTYDFTPYISQTFGENDMLMLSAVDTDKISVEITGFEVTVNAVDPDWFGTAPVEFTLSEEYGVISDRKSKSAGGLSTIKTVNIEVLPVNDAPYIDPAIPNAPVAQVGEVITYDLSTYKHDIDNELNDLSWSVEITNYEVEPGKIYKGNVTQDGDMFYFDPLDIDFGGQIEIAFTLTDGELSVTQEMIYIDWDDNYAPYLVTPFDAIHTQEDFDPSIVIDLQGHFEDPEGDELFYEVLFEEEHVDALVSGNRFVVISSVANWNGDTKVRVRAHDREITPTDLYVEAEIAVYVEAVNDAPVFALPTNISFYEDDSVTLDVSEFVTDVDNELSEIELSWTPGANIDVSATGWMVTFTNTEENWNGSETITFSVNDDMVGDAVVTSQIEVICMPVNDPPYIATPISNVTKSEDFETFTIDLDTHFADIEGDDISYGVTYNSDEISVAIYQNVLVVNSITNWNGTSSVTVTAYDAAKDKMTSKEMGSSDTFNVIVTPVNDAPVISLPSTITFNEDEGTMLDFTEYVTDVDNGYGELTLSWSGNQNVSIVDNDWMVTFENLITNWNGTENVTFYVTDDTVTEAIVSQMVTIEVIPVNDEPTIDIPENYEITEDGNLVVDMEEYVSDPEGNPLTLWATGYENIMVDIDGFMVTFTPAADWNGTEDIMFYVSDTMTDRAVASDMTSVTVIPAQDAPVIELPTQFTFAEDGMLNIDFTPYVSDVDGDDLTLSVSGNYEVDIMITGLSVEMTATENWNGMENVMFTVEDTAGNTADATADIIVTPVNDIPEIDIPDTFEFAEDGMLTVDFEDYISDIDGDMLTLSAYGNTNINIMITGHLVTFTAEDDWFGTEDITFVVSDGQATESKVLSRLTASDMTAVTVTPENDPPSIELPPSFTFSEDGNLEVDFEQYISDIEPDYLTLSVSGNSEVVVDITGTMVTFSATADWNGMETLTFTVSDNVTDATASDMVNVVVVPVNDAPVVATPIPDQNLMEDFGVVGIDLDDYFADVDNDNLIYTITATVPTEVIANVSGNMLTLQSVANWNGSTSITVQASDGHAAITKSNNRASVTDTFIVNVAPQNDPPYLVQQIQPMTVVEDFDSETQDLDMYFVDPDGDDLTYTVDFNPEHINASISGNMGTITSVPNWNGTTVVTVTADDGMNKFRDKRASVVAEFIITVLPVNDAPEIVGWTPQELVFTAQTSTVVFSVTADDIDNTMSELDYEWFVNYEHVNVDEPVLEYTFTQNGEYIVRCVVSDGSLTDEQIWTVTVNTVGIGDGNLPLTTELTQNYPNPFNPETSIKYSLAERGHVKLEIYNRTGRTVATLVNGVKNAGRYEVNWNGMESTGNACAAGVYYYRLTTPGYSKVMKAVLVK